MSSNLPLVRRSRRVLPWSGGLKLEINIPSQRIRAKWKGGLINEGGVISSEYGTYKEDAFPRQQQQNSCSMASSVCTGYIASCLGNISCTDLEPVL